MSTIKIPDHWTAEEALTVSSFLDDISMEIWDVHGKRMARAIQLEMESREREEALEKLIDRDDSSGIPF